jgi:hypothetical protein
MCKGGMRAMSTMKRARRGREGEKRNNFKTNGEGGNKLNHTVSI